MKEKENSLFSMKHNDEFVLVKLNPKDAYMFTRKNLAEKVFLGKEFVIMEDNNCKFKNEKDYQLCKEEMPDKHQNSFFFYRPTIKQLEKI